MKKKNLPDDKPSITTMDAKRRSIVSTYQYAYTPDNKPVEITTLEDGVEIKNPAKAIRICAEQFPDIFTVLSASLAGQIGAEQNGATQSAAAQLSAAVQQSGTTIARTQTVNLLREAMYRTCERYMNGALDEDSFVLQAMRDQQNMVSVLAIEQLTGVVTPPASRLQGISIAAGFSQGEIMALNTELAKAKEKRDIAKKTEADTQTAYMTMLQTGSVQTCEGLTENKEECEAAEAKYQLAKADYASESEHYDNVNKLVEVSSTAIGAAVSIANASNDPGYNNNLAFKEQIPVVAEAVKEIVKMTFDSNNVDTTCIQILLSDKSQLDGTLCHQWLNAEISSKLAVRTKNEVAIQKRLEEKQQTALRNTNQKIIDLESKNRTSEIEIEQLKATTKEISDKLLQYQKTNSAIPIKTNFSKIVTVIVPKVLDNRVSGSLAAVLENLNLGIQQQLSEELTSTSPTVKYSGDIKLARLVAENVLKVINSDISCQSNDLANGQPASIKLVVPASTVFHASTSETHSNKVIGCH